MRVGQAALMLSLKPRELVSGRGNEPVRLALGGGGVASIVRWLSARLIRPSADPVDDCLLRTLGASELPDLEEMPILLDSQFPFEEPMR